MFRKDQVRRMKEEPTIVQIDNGITVESYHPLMEPKEMWLRVSFDRYDPNTAIVNWSEFSPDEWFDYGSIKECIEVATDAYANEIRSHILTTVHKAI